MKKLKLLLILIAVVGIGVGLSYPIRYKLEYDSNHEELEDLSSMRRRVMTEQNVVSRDENEATAPTEAPPEETVSPTEPEPPATEQAVLQTETPQSATPPPTEPAERAETETAMSTEAPAETEASSDHTEEPPAQATAIPQTAEAAPVETAAAQPVETATSQQATVQPAETATSEQATVQPAETATSEQAAVQPAETATSQQATVQPTETATVEQATAQPAEAAPTPAVRVVTPTPGTPTPGIMDLLLNDVEIPTYTPHATSTPTPTPGPSPSPTPDRNVRDDADTFKDKQKVALDESLILPELKEIYALNHDLVGWLYIEDTNIDYPVVQAEDGKFYLTHDFYGKSNANGQIILEDKCDPYTPSYNLVLSGHHMNSGAMFGRLGRYKDKDYWEGHKIVEFDTLMARKRYIIFGAFYSADYDENEKGFRYSADIQYNLEAEKWLDEIKQNQIYETGIDAEFGDEFITLTTCDHSRRYDGRFVVVARRIREGEKIQ